MDNTGEYEINPNDIAIIGMSARFTGCDSVEQYWEALRDGIECLKRYTDEELIEAGVNPIEIENPKYVKAGGPLNQMEYFDAGFFGFSPKDAGIMDPQHRHFYECSWEAFENAGYTPNTFEGAVGVFAGCGPNLYFMRNVMTNADLVRSVGYFLLRHTGNDRDFMPTGISYKLNLQGPSVAVQTACSTSLVATHMACQSLLSGESDMALAGGITINIPHVEGYLYHDGEILSPDGHCRSFDAKSAGTVLTSGAGTVLLRRLEDAINDGDHIHAVIKASAINNDGSRKVGYLAPSVDGHAEVVSEALSLAGLEAEDISYLETHGTGTNVGDPIEITALTEAFRRTTDKKQYCPIGSVKTNIGHTDTAAGVAGMIKIVEALKQKQIPPSLHYTAPNPRIDFENSPFFVNNKLRDWQTSNGQPRRAGLSSLGVGGTNAHAIFEEAPAVMASDPARSCELLVLSAKNPASLDKMTENLAQFFKKNPNVNISDVAHTLQTGRDAFEHKSVVAVQNASDAAQVLGEKDKKRIASGKSEMSPSSLVFMFPGGGAQYPNMGRGLYETEPVYRQAIDECLNLLTKYIDFDLKSLMYPELGREEETRNQLTEVTASICSIFTTSYATAKLWMSKGFEPEAMTGHSLGEYVAACLAGVFSLEDALKIVALRGRVLGKVSHAKMLTVSLSHEELTPLLFGELDLSAINGPELCLVSGPEDQIDQLVSSLEAKEIDCKKLHIATASHCRLLDPILDEFLEGMKTVQLHEPQKKFICNVTGTWAKPEDVVQPEYWVRHFREPVHFHQGVGELLSDTKRIFIEVGPGTTMCSLVRQQKQKPKGLLSSLRHPNEEFSDVNYFQTAIGRLWLSGMEVDWMSLRNEERRLRVPLPTYPFDRQRYWIEPTLNTSANTVEDLLPPIKKLENKDDWFYDLNWQQSGLAEKAENEEGPILIFGDSFGLAENIAKELKNNGREVIFIREGDSYYKFNDNEYAIAAEEGRFGYDSLLADLSEREKMPSRILHFWMITAEKTFRPGSNFFHHIQERGYYSIVFLMQALGEIDHQEKLHIDIISDGMQAIQDEKILYPEKTTLLGTVRVVPREFLNVTIRSVDIQLGDITEKDKVIASLSPMVLNECVAAHENEVVAYRDGIRYMETIEPFELNQNDGIGYRENGTYFITGGLGGIGLKIAEYLAVNYKANLVLLSHSEIPPEDKWDEWLSRHSEHDRISLRIKQVRKLEELGASVIPASGDVANIDQMHKVLSKAKAKFRKIDGVIHAAGYLEDGVLQAKTLESMERVFTPKVHGTIVLADLFKNDKLDFFVLFSSTSSILGPAGQVDYTAANCFLNSLTQTEAADHLNYITVDWGVWKDVGAGRNIALRIRGEDVDGNYLHQLAKHPLLDEILFNEYDETLFSTKLNVESQWILNEHKTAAGQALIPGTGYLEILRGVCEELTDKTAVEIKDVSFFAPLNVDEGEEKEMRVSVKRDGARYSVEFTSKSKTNLSSSWVTNATGSFQLLEPETKQINLSEIVNRSGPVDNGVADQQKGLLDFGPRWHVVQEAHFNESEGIALMKLHDDYLGDLEFYKLHPAILDIATGYGLPLIDGYARGEVLYVPLSYSSVKIYAPLTQEIYSYVTLNKDNQANDEVVGFDVVITNEQGTVLVEVKNFMVKKIANARSFAQADLDSTQQSNQFSAGEQFFLDTIEHGILAEEGIAALERVIQAGRNKPVFVSSIDLQNLMAHESRVNDTPDTDGIKYDRPSLQSEYEPPRDSIETTLAEYWEDLLGVSNIGINDEFFELGGHSLIAVRLFAKIKKKWGVEYPISVLFQAPTIAAGADMLRAELGIGLGEEQAGDIQKDKPSFSLLVPMTKVGQGSRPPFYLVAGMFGNVLNLRHLATHLGQEQTVYAIQARGLYGDDKPHNRFEDMAKDSLAAIREVQPEGPYFIGGFSGGGIVAYEMAQQLLAAGEEIGTLVMLDSIPARIPTATKMDRLKIQLIHMGEQGLKFPINWAVNRYNWETRKLWKNKEEMTPAEFRSEEIEAAFLEACAVYEHKPYPGQVELFRPPFQERYVMGPGRVLNESREYLDEANHWRQYITGKLNVHMVTGDHDSMVLEPHVRVLANKLKVCLNEAYKNMESKLGNSENKVLAANEAAE